MKIFQKTSAFLLILTSVIFSLSSSCKKDKGNPPVVTTAAISAISQTSAESGGNITDDGGSSVVVKGVCWNTTPDPTTSNSKTDEGSDIGNFSSSMTGLTPGTTYYVKAYATNSTGTGYGNQVTFTTLVMVNLPAVTTTAANNIAQNSATAGGNITSNGGGVVNASGVCFGVNQNPTLSDGFTVDGTGSGQFTSQMLNLLPGTTYYVRAYATNSAGTSYGNQVSFSTLKGLAVVNTRDITEVSAMGGVSGGIIISDGGQAISEKGICWSELPDPTTDDNVIVSGSGPSSYNSAIVTAVPGTTYYVRSYVTNESGTSYGDQKTFTTLGNVNYYSFESGLIPAGWVGEWAVSNSKAFVGSYCLTSLHGVNSETSLTVTIANSGQISFYYFLDWSTASGFSVSTSIDFYIDDVLAGNFPSSSGWHQALFDVSAGTHTFKWRFNARYMDGQAYIDYIIFPK